MTEEQYKRANAVVYPILAAVMILNLFMLSVVVIRGEGLITTFIQLSVQFVSIIVSSVVYVTNRAKRICLQVR